MRLDIWDVKLTKLFDKRDSKFESRSPTWVEILFCLYESSIKTEIVGKKDWERKAEIAAQIIIVVL